MTESERDLDGSDREASASTSDPVDPVQRALDETVLSSLGPVTTALAAFYLVLAVAHVVVLEPPSARVMAPVAVLSGGVLLLVRRLLERPDTTPGSAHVLGAAVAGVVLANSLLHLGITLEPRQTTNLVILVVGVGVIFLDGAWFSVVVAATFAGWLAVAVDTPGAPTAPAWVHFGFALVAATVLATAVLVSRKRTIRRIERLHRRERLRQLELEASLERAEEAARGEAEARWALEMAVARLRESERRFRRLSAATFEGVAIHREGRVIDANATVADLFGYSLGELLDREILELFEEESQARAESHLTLEGHGAKGPAKGDGKGDETVSFEAVGRRRDGTIFPVEVAVAATSHEGEPATVVVFRDVTAHKRVEEMLIRAAREAEASNEAKSAFLATMSHELRTPLNAVIGFGNILEKDKEGTLTERQHGYLDRVLSNARHLLELIDGILDLSRLDAGGLDVLEEEVAPGPVVREVVASFEDAAQRKGIELRWETPPTRTITADRTRLRQVVSHLVSNAIKFTPSGGVEVRVVAAEDRPLRIEVEDTGIGIPAEAREGIFDPFRQVDSSTSRSFGGTGLGLAVASALCRVMGFTLEVESREGEGSIFTIDLTAAGENAAASS